MHGACIYPFLLCLHIFLRNALLTDESNVNTFDTNYFVIEILPYNQHHLYTFLVIRKHNLLKFTSAIQSIQNIQDSKNDCTFIYSRQLLVFYFCYSEYRKTNKRFICISRFLTKEAFHCISLHLSVENDKFRYLGKLLN